MKTVVYCGFTDEVTTADGAVTFPNGTPVECSDELADALCARSDFKLVEPAKADKKKENDN